MEYEQSPDLGNMPDMNRNMNRGMPRTQTPDGQMPGTRMPDGQMPDNRMPDGQMPNGQMPGTRMPDGQMPGTRMPDGQMPGTRMPDGQMPDNRMRENDMSNMIRMENEAVLPVHLSLAMAYVPYQPFENFFDNETALRRGTLFKALDLPFYGGNGGRK